MAKAKKVESTILDIHEIDQKEITFNLLGTHSLIMNRFSQKAWQELLYPSEKRNRASMEQTLKHDPLAEYRGGMYRVREPRAPTLIHIPSGAIHGALAQVAVDIPGAARAKIERLTRVVDETVHLYGVPQLYMAMVRNSDMNRTPDVRTRPIFPQWACTVTIRFVSSVLTQRTISHLLGAAGTIVGLGDWRGEKGGPHGAFKVVGDDNAAFRAIVRDQGRKAQQAAYDHPQAFDLDTEELLSWFQTELLRREKEPESAAAKPKKGKVRNELDGGVLDVIAGNSGGGDGEEASA